VDVSDALQLASEEPSLLAACVGEQLLLQATPSRVLLLSTELLAHWASGPAAWRHGSKGGRRGAAAVAASPCAPASVASGALHEVSMEDAPGQQQQQQQQDVVMQDASASGLESGSGAKSEVSLLRAQAARVLAVHSGSPPPPPLMPLQGGPAAGAPPHPQPRGSSPAAGSSSGGGGGGGAEQSWAAQQLAALAQAPAGAGHQPHIILAAAAEGAAVVALHPGDQLVALQVVEPAPGTQQQLGALSRKRSRPDFGLAAAGCASLPHQLSCMCLHAGPQQLRWLVGASYGHTLELLLLLPGQRGLLRVASLAAGAGLAATGSRVMGMPEAAAAAGRPGVSGGGPAVAEDIAVLGCWEQQGATALDVLVTYRDSRVAAYRLTVCATRAQLLAAAAAAPCAAAAAAREQEAGGGGGWGGSAAAAGGAPPVDVAALRALAARLAADPSMADSVVDAMLDSQAAQGPGPRHGTAAAGAAAASGGLLGGVAVTSHLLAFLEAGSAPSRILGPLDPEQEEGGGEEGEEAGGRRGAPLRYLLHGAELLELQVQRGPARCCGLSAAPLLREAWQAVPLCLGQVRRQGGAERGGRRVLCSWLSCAAAAAAADGPATAAWPAAAAWPAVAERAPSEPGAASAAPGRLAPGRPLPASATDPASLWPPASQASPGGCGGRRCCCWARAGRCRW
jgi:hypothetical protein